MDEARPARAADHRYRLTRAGHERSRLEGLRVPPLEHRDGFFAATTVTIAACRRVSREEFLPASEPAPEPTTATDAAVRLPVSEAEGKGA
jgi:hypothetical protein